MTAADERTGPLLRIFEVEAKPGHVETLLGKFATTSAAVVRGEPGNRGYFFGRCVQGGENRLLFVSVWADLAAVKARFGEDWERSYLPPGYEELVEHHSIRHVDAADGWHVDR